MGSGRVHRVGPPTRGTAFCARHPDLYRQQDHTEHQREMGHRAVHQGCASNPVVAAGGPRGAHLRQPQQRHDLRGQSQRPHPRRLTQAPQTQIRERDPGGCRSDATEISGRRQHQYLPMGAAFPKARDQIHVPADRQAPQVGQLVLHAHQRLPAASVQHREPAAHGLRLPGTERYQLGGG